MISIESSDRRVPLHNGSNHFVWLRFKIGSSHVKVVGVVLQRDFRASCWSLTRVRLALNQFADFGCLAQHRLVDIAVKCYPVGYSRYRCGWSRILAEGMVRNVDGKYSQ